MAALGAIGSQGSVGAGAAAAAPSGGASSIGLAARVVLTIGTWLNVILPGQLPATFPDYPILLFPGFTEKPDPVVRRTDMESGPPKQLTRSARAMVKRPVSYLIVSKTDKDSFMTWFNVAINRGADWFNWLDPYDGVVKPARIVGGALDPKPQIKSLTRWVIAFQIETWSG